MNESELAAATLRDFTTTQNGVPRYAPKPLDNRPIPMTPKSVALINQLSAAAVKVYQENNTPRP